VAQHLGISVRQLTRMFQAKHGVPLGEWSLNERLALAQSLLATELSIPVKVVAAECGFSNVSNFCLRFSRRFLSTPARYRAHCQQDIGKQPAQKNPKRKPTL
jgi:AraC family transcriptional regulator